MAKKVLNDIKEYGVVKRGMVGVQFHELNQDAADELKIDRNTGLYVDDVVAGIGAEQAGIKKGDIITKVAGNNAYSSSDLEEPVGRLQPGDKVNLTVLHDGGERNVSVTLKADLPAEHIAAAPKSAEELYNKLGASFTPLTQAQKTRLHVNGGVMVAQVRRGGDPAAEKAEAHQAPTVKELCMKFWRTTGAALCSPVGVMPCLMTAWDSAWCLGSLSSRSGWDNP